MKTIKNIIYIILAFIIIYILQTQFLNYFTIAWVKPNLFIILVIFIAFKKDKYWASISGIFIGFFLDIIIGKNIGFSLIFYGLLGYIVGYSEKYLSKESKITNLLVILFATIGLETAIYITQIILRKINLEAINFIKICIIEAIYNNIILLILYPLWKKLIYKEELNGKRSISRYL